VQLAKPDGVYVKAQDRKTGKSKTITVYNTSVEQFMDQIKSKILGPDAPKPRRGRRPAVAA
jgi:hypothetical protein